MLLRLQNSFASMDQMVRRQERTAVNLANANTIGYKRTLTFTEALNERFDAEQAPRSDRRSTPFADLTQGELQSTDNPLDVALNSEGFFVVTDEGSGQSLYSRAGRFVLGEDGTLRDGTGRTVQGQDGPIQLPLDGQEITISKSGEVLVDKQPVGTLRVVTFDDPLQLQRTEGSAFLGEGLQPQDVEQPVVMQGYVEGSNVDAIDEMVTMMEHLRLFESQQRVLRTTDQVLGSAVRDLGKF